MNESFDFYFAQAQSRSESPDWFAELQEQAVKDFSRLDFPTRKDEDWKYTALTSFFKHRFLQVPSSETVADANANEVVIANGEITGLEALASQLPKGALVLPIRQAIETHPELVKPYLGQILDHEHGFQALNTALMHTGLFVYLPEGVCVPQPIVIQHTQMHEQAAVHCRHLVVAKANSEAVITERYTGHEAASYLTNVMTEVVLCQGAKLTHHKLQNEGKQAFHIGHVAVKQHADSQFISHALSYGSQLARGDMTIDLMESHASCVLNGLYVPTTGQHVDHHTLINHRVPECVSKQDYRGILDGKTRAVFNGRVIVALDAQKTQADQSNKNLLLSTDAEIDTKPQLEIFANDVICTHGATVGQLDKEALFYMASRGIPPQEASQYLIHAFAENNLSMIDDKSVREEGEALLNQAMEANHG